MRSKLIKLLGSIRFWIITLASAAAYMALVEKFGFSWSSMLDAMSIWLGVVAGVGTIDKIVAKK